MVKRRGKKRRRRILWLIKVREYTCDFINCVGFDIVNLNYDICYDILIL